MNNRKNTTQILVISAMFAALACVATMIIKVPSPLNGYVNLGDSIVLLAGWMLPPAYGFMAAGIGSAMADVFSGYALYAPATFVIKGIMAVIANRLAKKSTVAGGIIAELAMVGGYLLFESFLYSFVPSLANIPANCVQCIVCLVIALVAIRFVKRNPDSFRL